MLDIVYCRCIMYRIQEKHAMTIVFIWWQEKPQTGTQTETRMWLKKGLAEGQLLRIEEKHAMTIVFIRWQEKPQTGTQTETPMWLKKVLAEGQLLRIQEKHAMTIVFIWCKRSPRQVHRQRHTCVCVAVCGSFLCVSVCLSGAHFAIWWKYCNLMLP